MRDHSQDILWCRPSDLAAGHAAITGPNARRWSWAWLCGCRAQLWDSTDGLPLAFARLGPRLGLY
jgi:hypothetical protein